MAAAPERRDARLGHGCGQSEQHGASAHAALQLRGAAEPDRRLECGRHRDPRDHAARCARAESALVPAHGDGGQGLPPAAGARRARPLGDRGHGASGQVSRYRRSADRTGSPRPAKSGETPVAAAPGNGDRGGSSGAARADAEAVMLEYLEQVPSWVWPIAAATVVIAAAVWVYILYRRWRVRRDTEAAIASVAYEMLKNVLLPNGNGGQIHIQYLLLTQRGLLVADLLDRPGAIFGGDQMLEWTAIGKKRRYTFPNPQHALYDRMAAVRLLTEDVPVEGRLLFTLQSEFPKGKPRNALRIDEL